MRVAAESSGGISDYSETCFVSTEPVSPDAPLPPTLKDKPKCNSLHLCWSPPDYDGGAPVTEYEIDMTSPDNTTKGVYRGRDTECVVASLAPGRPYLFQVRAQNRAGQGAWSAPLEVISGAGPPDRPKEPRAFAKSGSTASVSWESPINNGAIITGYKLELAQVSDTPVIVESESEDEEEETPADVPEEDDDAESVYSDDSDVSDIGDSTVEASTNCDTVDNVEDAADTSIEEPPPEPKELVWRLVYSGAESSTEIRDLVPALQYQLRVCALNSAGASNYSCNVSMEMPASAPAMPFNLTMTKSTSSSLFVKWKKPADHGDPIKNYIVEWGVNEKELTSVTAERRRINLLDLRPDTGYLIRVQAVNARGRGQFSPFLKVSTRPLPPAPPKLECLTVSHNQLKLRWGESKISLGTQYILETENSRKLWHQIYTGNNHSFKVGKLMENTEYRYRVCAISEAGQGPFSGVSTFKTSFAPPAPLKSAPRVSDITDTGCLVQWNSLKSSGDMLSYRVQLTRVKDGHVSTYEAGSDVQFGVEGLDPKSDYTVRVCAVRMVTNDDGSQVPMVGTLSPCTQLNTLAKQGLTTSAVTTTKVETVKSGVMEPHRTDQQWAVIILCGFTLFAVVVAMIIQQVISLSS